MLVKRLVANMNGITIAYIMAAVNALLSLMLSFGLALNTQQQIGIVAFVNTSLATLAHLSHRLGENEAQIKASPAEEIPTRAVNGNA